MKALVIYDVTGRIWSIIYGEETLPQGLRCMWVDIPDGAQLNYIDVTDASTHSLSLRICLSQILDVCRNRW